MFFIWVGYKEKSQSAFKTMKIWDFMVWFESWKSNTLSNSNQIGQRQNWDFLTILFESFFTHESNQFLTSHLHLIWFESNIVHDLNHIVSQHFPVGPVAFSLNYFCTWFESRSPWFESIKKISKFYFFFYYTSVIHLIQIMSCSWFKSNWTFQPFPVLNLKDI